MLHVYMTKKTLKRQGPGRKDPYVRVTVRGVFLSGPGVKLLGETGGKVACAFDDEAKELHVWVDPHNGAFKLGTMRSATRRVGGKRLAVWLAGLGVEPGKYAAYGEEGKVVAKVS